MDNARMFPLLSFLREGTSHSFTFLSVIFASHLGGRVLLAGVKEN